MAPKKNLSTTHRIIVGVSIIATTIIGVSGQAQGAPAPSGPSAPTRTMPRLGESGPHVTALQQALVRQGFTLRGGVTGTFDQNTVRTLVNFQRVVGLKATGTVEGNSGRAGHQIGEITTHQIGPPARSKSRPGSSAEKVDDVGARAEDCCFDALTCCYLADPRRDEGGSRAQITIELLDVVFRVRDLQVTTPLDGVEDLTCDRALRITPVDSP